MTTGTLNNMDESLKLSAEWKKPCIKSIGRVVAHTVWGSWLYGGVHFSKLIKLTLATGTLYWI